MVTITSDMVDGFKSSGVMTEAAQVSASTLETAAELEAERRASLSEALPPAGTRLIKRKSRGLTSTTGVALTPEELNIRRAQFDALEREKRERWAREEAGEEQRARQLPAYMSAEQRPIAEIRESLTTHVRLWAPGDKALRILANCMAYVGALGVSGEAVLAAWHIAVLPQGPGAGLSGALVQGLGVGKEREVLVLTSMALIR